MTPPYFMDLFHGISQLFRTLYPCTFNNIPDVASVSETLVLQWLKSSSSNCKLTSSAIESFLLDLFCEIKSNWKKSSESIFWYIFLLQQLFLNKNKIKKIDLSSTFESLDSSSAHLQVIDNFGMSQNFNLVLKEKFENIKKEKFSKTY